MVKTVSTHKKKQQVSKNENAARGRKEELLNERIEQIKEKAEKTKNKT